MMGQITRLWRGEETLARAFWEYAILYGTLLNLIATAGMFAALATGLPGALALAIHGLPLPYDIFIAVSVWRSAGRYPGTPEWALLARIAIVAWAVIMAVV